MEKRFSGFSDFSVVLWLHGSMVNGWMEYAHYIEHTKHNDARYSFKINDIFVLHLAVCTKCLYFL